MVERFDLKPGYTISRILKGGWQLAGGHSDIDREAAIRDMQSYVEAGVTTFDCADIYTGVEQMIGDFRRDALARGRVDLVAPLKVHTKFVPDRDVLATMTRADAEAIVDRSLARLGLERLDLVQFHWWNTDVRRYVEVANWLAEFQKKGKIDLLGVTNFNDAATREILDSGVALATTQVQYSVLDTRVEKKLVETARRHGMKLLCYGTVAGGFLSEAWLDKPEPVEPLENRSLTKYKLIVDDIGGWDVFQAILRALRAVGQRHGVGIADVAMRHVLDRPQVAGVIVGVRHGGHLAAHRRVTELALDAADRAEIDAALALRKELEGDFYDLERDANGRHGRIMKYNLNAA
ncbi:aldo/keto reductase [Alsobacter sp. SYSU M60028]|uniref:Aldo/keto reductase n=1 Tax=Alsobacter ponti TaxID=2962936 RepID=A0ABT1L8Y8_9HYPH|nr:aldo/keto reductase [Alsobacter ponti]MCP8937937.1 aldo/keto reductase [Alsobacter ponti]